MRFHHCRQTIAILFLLILPLSAQRNLFAKEPAAVISIASVEKLTADVIYLTQLFGQPDAGRFAVMATSPVLQPLDPTRPSGILVYSQGDQYIPVAFVPANDFQSLLLLAEQQFGKPEELEGGIKKFLTPSPVFVASNEKWGFASNRAKELAELPEHPDQLLGELPNQYDLAVKLFVQRIPKEQRQAMIDQGKTAALNDENPKKMLAIISEMEKISEEAEELQIGWNIDSENQSTHFDFTFAYQAESSTAKSLAVNAEVSSDFVGFELTDAVFFQRKSQKVTESDLPFIQFHLNSLRDVSNQGAEELDEQEKIEQRMFDSLIGQLKQAAKSGVLDTAISARYEPKNSFLFAAARIADGAKIDDALLKLKQDLGQKTPDFQWNADSHKGVRLHIADRPEVEGTEKLFSPKAQFVVGVAPKHFYIALGEDAAEKLKSAIDRSESSKKVDHFSYAYISMANALEFAQALMDEVDGEKGNLEEAVEDARQIASAGNDRLVLESTINGNHVNHRVTLQSNVISATGVIAKPIIEALQSVARFMQPKAENQPQPPAGRQPQD